MNAPEATRSLPDRFANHRVARFSRIQTRLTVFFILILAAALAVTSLVSYRQSSAAMNGKVDLYSRQIINQIGAEIDLDLQHVESAMEDLASSEGIQSGLTGLMESGGHSLKWTTMINKEIAHKLSMMNYISSIQIAVDENMTLGTYNSLDKTRLKEIISGSGENPDVRFALIEDRSSGKLNIAVSRRIQSSVNGKALGTLVMTVEENRLRKLYESVDLGPGADLFLMDATGIVVSSNNPAKLPLNRPVADGELARRALEKPKNDSEAYFGSAFGSSSLVSSTKVGTSGWTVVAIIPRTFIQSELVRLQRSMVLIGVGCLLVSALVAYVISLGVSVPSRKLVQAMKRVNEGDLSVDLVDANNDEMGAIVRGFGEMIATLRGLIGRTHASAQEMQNQARATSELAEGFKGSIHSYVASIRQIAVGSGQQASEAAAGFECMHGLAERIDRISEGMNSIHGAIADIGAVCGQSRELMEALNEKTERSNAVSRAVNEHIGYLNRELATVTDIVRLMTDIAKQTNILAINAAIEASRAGSAGSGFAVVADEVRKLAEQSRVSSERIAQMIAAVMDSARATVREADSAKRILEEQNEAVKRTGRTFERIGKEVDGILGFVAGVRRSSDEMMVSKDQTLKAIERISGVAEQTAAVTGDVYSGSEEHMRGTEQLAEMAASIQDVSLELSAAVSRFKAPDHEGSD